MCYAYCDDDDDDDGSAACAISMMIIIWVHRSLCVCVYLIIYMYMYNRLNSRATTTTKLLYTTITTIYRVRVTRQTACWYNARIYKYIKGCETKAGSSTARGPFYFNFILFYFFQRMCVCVCFCMLMYAPCVCMCILYRIITNRLSHIRIQTHVHMCVWRRCIKIRTRSIKRKRGRK